MSWWKSYALRSIVHFANREATGLNHAIDQLRTRFLLMDRAAAWRHVQACIEGLGWRWRIADETPASGQFRLVRKSLLRDFSSDVTISLWPADGRRTAVDLASVSQAGRIDFGQNARNIRDFYRALEAYLQRLPGNGSERQSKPGDDAEGTEPSGAVPGL